MPEKQNTAWSRVFGRGAVLKTTNYDNTFILVSEDCPVLKAETPKPKSAGPTIASAQYELIINHPYELSSDDILFLVHAQRNKIDKKDIAHEREVFFSKGQACLRSSPLVKRYGWGIHHDAQGRVAIFPMESERYRQLAHDGTIKRLRGIRSKRK